MQKKDQLRVQYCNPKGHMIVIYTRVEMVDPEKWLYSGYVSKVVYAY